MDKNKTDVPCTVDTPAFRSMVVSAGYDLPSREKMEAVISHIDAHTARAVAAEKAETKRMLDTAVMYQKLWSEAKAAAPQQHAQAALSDEIVPSEWLSEPSGGSVSHLSYGYGFRRGFNHCREEVITRLAAIHQPAAAPAAQSMVIGFPDPNAVFAAFCDREGYPSDGDMDEALRKAFWEAVRMFSGDIPSPAQPEVKP